MCECVCQDVLSKKNGEKKEGGVRTSKTNDEHDQTNPKVGLQKRTK